jgi:hypothetical protein
VHQFANGLQPVGYHAERADFTSRFGHRDGDRIGVDIETNKA